MSTGVKLILLLLLAKLVLYTATVLFDGADDGEDVFIGHLATAPTVKTF